MGEERDADTDIGTCTRHCLECDLGSRKLITNVGQCGQDDIIIQTEGMKLPEKALGRVYDF